MLQHVCGHLIFNDVFMCQRRRTPTGSGTMKAFWQDSIHSQAVDFMAGNEYRLVTVHVSTRCLINTVFDYPAASQQRPALLNNRNHGASDAR
jgi:hypothetical protein